MNLLAKKIIKGSLPLILFIGSLVGATYLAWGVIIWNGGDVIADNKGWAMPEIKKMVYGLRAKGFESEIITKQGVFGGDVIYDENHSWIIVFNLPKALHDALPSNPLLFANKKEEWPEVMLYLLAGWWF